AAILGAVADVSAYLYWFDPHSIRPIGNHIGFAGQLRHPETVHDIRRLQLEESRLRLARLADWHVKFICRHDTKLRVANFPPPLVADHRDIERVGRRDSAL